MITVSEVMSTQVKTINLSESISTAKTMMKQDDIRHIPVVDNKNYPVGIISQRDILRAQVSDLTKNEPRTIDEELVAVEQIMSKKISYAHPSDPLRGAGIEMQQHKFGCLPVIENDQLVGIITDSDFVSVAINLIEQMDLSEDM
jgi:CBS domain-containing membrane protein